jgi:hypothetical protein
MSWPLWDEKNNATPGHKPGDMYPPLDTLKQDHMNPANEPGDNAWQGGPEPPLQQAQKPSQQQDKDS